MPTVSAQPRHSIIGTSAGLAFCSDDYVVILYNYIPMNALIHLTCFIMRSICTVRFNKPSHLQECISIACHVCSSFICYAKMQLSFVIDISVYRLRC